MLTMISKEDWFSVSGETVDFPNLSEPTVAEKRVDELEKTLYLIWAKCVEANVKAGDTSLTFAQIKSVIEDVIGCNSITAFINEQCDTLISKM